MDGHLVIQQKAFDTAMYASISNGENALLVRAILQQLGNNLEASMFIERPLTTYYTPGHGNKDIIPKEERRYSNWIDSFFVVLVNYNPFAVLVMGITF